MTQLLALIDGNRFQLRGRPGAVGLIDYQGQEWLQLKCWQGDRDKNDAPDRERIGLDGWPDPYRWGERVQLDLTIIPRAYSLANEGGWTNFFECHEKAYPGRGFIALISEWSAGQGKPVTRLRLGNEIVWQGEMIENYRYPFRFDFIAGGEGHFRAWLHNQQIADWRGFIGHDPRYPLYPQHRIYRATRKETAMVLLRVSETRSVPAT